MMTLRIDIQDAAARAGIARFMGAARDAMARNEAAAAGVENEVQEHLLGLNSRSPNTSFYGRAARSTETDAREDGATVSITARGLALRYYGGQVLPKLSISSFTGRPTKALALPTDAVPMAGSEGRMGPREVGILAFIPSKKAGTVGVLVEGQNKTITRGPNQGGTRVVPTPGGRLMFVLRSWTDHAPDPSVLPTHDDLTQAAASGLSEFLRYGGEDLS